MDFISYLTVIKAGSRNVCATLNKTQGDTN